ncbi:MAG: fibronectin type III domain-containing protein [Lachnospiraceae bacterium]|nr:fibronectin type III domain-containing protein [Lachnospiraceae bacterium]
MKLKSPKSKTIKVSWKKDSQADGYQIQYAENSKFTTGKKSVTITKRLTGSKAISHLRKGRKYYVRIRAYKKIDGKKCYGSWSKTKKVKSK